MNRFVILEEKGNEKWDFCFVGFENGKVGWVSTEVIEDPMATDQLLSKEWIVILLPNDVAPRYSIPLSFSEVKTFDIDKGYFDDYVFRGKYLPELKAWAYVEGSLKKVHEVEVET